MTSTEMPTLPAEPAAVLALVPGYTEAAATAALSWALSQVEDHCQRRFRQATSTITVSAHGGVALLPNPPVIEVETVEGLVRWPLFAALDWHELDGFTVLDDGQIFDSRVDAAAGVPWPVVPRGLRVTYTHGFAEWPQPVVSAVVALACAYIVNPAGMATRRVLDVTYMWADGVGPGGVADPFAGLSEYVLAEVG